MSVDQPAIHALAISPDSQFAASGGEDGEIKLWRLGSGTEIRTFSGHSSRILALAFSPDGLKILSGSADKTLKLWDVVSGREITTLTGHSSSVFAVAFSASGSRALSASSDTTLRLWDLITGKQLKVFGECSKTTGTVAFFNDGSYALTGSLDPAPKPFAQFAMGGKDIRVWEVATGREVQRLVGKAYNVSAVAISADNKYVAVGDFNQTVTVWNNITGQAILTLHGRSQTPVEDWSEPTQSTLIPLRVDMDRPDGILALSFSPDGRYLIGSVDRTLNVWDITTGKLVKTIVADDARIVTVAYSPDGHLICVGGFNPRIKVWNAVTGRLHTRLEGTAIGIEHMSVGPDGSFVIAGTRERLWIWDIIHGKLIGTLSGYRGALRGVAVLPDGKRVVSASGDNSIRVFDLSSGTSILNLKNQTSDLWSVALSPTGDRILIGTLEGTTSVWDLSKQAQRFELPGSHIVDDIAFTSDGRYALIGYSHMRYKHGTGGGVFMDSTGNGPMDVAAAAIFGWKYSTTDGDDSSSQDVRLWDLETGKIIRNFDKDDKADRGVTSVAVAHDNRYVAAGDRNGIITVWNLLERVS